jgi:hypothetical protein
MDFLRQSRYVIPPFLLLIALLSAAYVDGRLTLTSMNALGAPAVALSIALVGAATLPAGFLIGGIAFLCVRAVCRLRGHTQYEVCLSEDAWTKVWSTLTTPSSKEMSYTPE